MKIVFFGTPDYVLGILESLHKKFKTKASQESPIVAVVTQNPKPIGRKKFISYSPVDTWAHKRGLPVFHSARELISSGLMPDLGVLAAYGEIIPSEVISFFPHGILNVHPSLLPKFRGASPIQATLVIQEQETGVSVIKIDAQTDHGPVVTQFRESIEKSDTLDSLRVRLFDRASQVLAELIEPYVKGKITLKQQDDKQASYTTLIKKQHGFIPGKYLNYALAGKTPRVKWDLGFIKEEKFTPNAALIDRFIRALTPWPGAWTEITLGTGWNFSQKRLKILKSHLEDDKLVLDEVQLEGKNPISWKQFLAGYPKAALGKE